MLLTLDQSFLHQHYLEILTLSYSGSLIGHFNKSWVLIGHNWHCAHLCSCPVLSLLNLNVPTCYVTIMRSREATSLKSILFESRSFNLQTKRNWQLFSESQRIWKFFIGTQLHFLQCCLCKLIISIRTNESGTSSILTFGRLRHFLQFFSLELFECIFVKCRMFLVFANNIPDASSNLGSLFWSEYWNQWLNFG